jgi:pilus assembly protein CpaF
MSIVLQGVDNRKRIYTIEDTRELLLEKLDENGYRINDLVQVYTKDDADENKRVTMDMLLRAALRMHPAIIVPAEMRGKEAVDAVEAGRTGHTIVSTLHANSAREAYPRIMTMYQKGDNTLSENTILSMIVEAFPILVYKEMMDDGSRKYTEIFEAEGVKDGKVVGRTLFKFEETGKDYDESGKLIKIRGEHKQVSSISKRLYSILKKRDIKDEVLKEYYYDN